MTTEYYPRPGPVGGRLIRQVIAFLRSQAVELPINSHILIAISGGADSVALAHLITHFGRRIVPRTQISFLHINHGWRGEESNGDEEFVKSLGLSWNIPVKVKRLKPPTLGSGDSWEDVARQSRKRIYAAEAKRLKGTILTAHHGDDLAETVLWRLFTGAVQTHGGGVAFRHGVEMRPFLKIRKADILEYLAEVSQNYREDSTNRDERFLRARMRGQIMPSVEKTFPKAIEHLISLALDAQDRGKLEKREAQVQENEFSEPHEILFGASGLRARRPHLEMILKKWVAKKPRSGEIHLPGGWRLIHSKSPKERWVLEKI